MWLLGGFGFLAQGAEASYAGKLLISPSPSRAETKEMPHPFNLYGTHLEILRSAELVKRAELRVQSTHPELGKSAVKVTANHLEGTGFISVSGEGSNADYTRVFIDSLMDEYRAFIMEAAEKQLGGTLNKVIEEVLSREKQVKDKFSRLNDFLQKTDQVVLEGDRNRAADYVQQLRDQLGLFHAELGTMERLKMDDYLRSKAGPAAGSNVAATPRENSAFGGLARSEESYLDGLSHLRILESQRMAMLKTHKESHEAVRELDKKIEEQRDLNEINHLACSEDWTRRLAGLKLKISTIEEQLMEHTAKAREANEKIVQQQILKSEYERSLEDYKDWKKVLDRMDRDAILLPAIPVIFERAALATAK